MKPFQLLAFALVLAGIATGAYFQSKNSPLAEKGVEFSRAKPVLIWEDFKREPPLLVTFYNSEGSIAYEVKCGEQRNSGYVIYTLFRGWVSDLDRLVAAKPTGVGETVGQLTLHVDGSQNICKVSSSQTSILAIVKQFPSLSSPY